MKRDIGSLQEKYYSIKENSSAFLRSAMPDFENYAILSSTRPSGGGVGFGAAWVENKPSVKFKKIGSKKVLDFYKYGNKFWLVSDRLKTLLQKFDGEAFVFCEANVNCADDEGVAGRLWFCDVVRVLECIDEARSDIRFQEGIDWKHYAALIDVKMQPDVVRGFHIFRPKFCEGIVIGDQAFLDMIKKEKISGLLFEALDGTLKAVK